MKSGIKIIEMALCACAAFGWWGILYPELAMTPDTYKVVREEKPSAEEKTLISLNAGNPLDKCNSQDGKAMGKEADFQDDQAMGKEVTFEDGETYGEERITKKGEASPKEDNPDGLQGIEIYSATDWDFDREIYFEILQADARQVRFKSRLLMCLKEIFE